MNSLVGRNLFFVKEHVGMFKAANEFDILDPESGQPLMHCREPSLGFFTKFLRFTDYKRMTPFDVELRVPQGEQILRVKRGVSFFLSKVDVLDENNVRVGGFKQKLFSIGGSFVVVDAQDQPVCTLKGKWTGWEFKFLGPDGSALASVTKKWAGLGKELFTTADNYVLQISEHVKADAPVRLLILAAVLCIDMVLKE